MVDVLATSAQGPFSPAWRVRVALLSDALRTGGVSLTLAPLFTAGEYDGFTTGAPAERARVLWGARRRLTAELRSTRSCSAVMIQRQVDLLPSLRLERLAVGDARLVLDLDDAVWIDGPASGGHPLAFLKRSARKLKWLAGRAHEVLAGNDWLAEYVSRYSDHVTVVPSLIDAARYEIRVHEERDPVVVGWIGSPTTAPYLAAALPTLVRMAETVAPRRVELIMVGGEIPAPRNVELTVLPWSEANERDALARMDIGLMPLPDDAWTRGKCAYKALQYMAAGIPVLADPVGVSGEVIGDGRGGYVVPRSDWPDAFSALAGDEDLRSRMGATGRRQVIDGFSYERWIPVIASTLKGH